MKRGTPDHPKTKTLCSTLGIPRWGAVGVLESIWHFTSHYAKRGDIGKWTNVEIANAIGWQDDADALIDALVECKFLDESTTYRLLVHDWQAHSDQTVRRTDEVQKLGFASDQLAETSRRQAKTVQPSPSPSPKTPTEYISSADADGAHQKRNTDFDGWWACYPRKVGKEDSRKKYIAAIKRICKDHELGPREATVWLLERTVLFAASPKAKGEFCPHPSTWLNQGRYDDDDASWKAQERQDAKSSEFKQRVPTEEELEAWTPS